MRRRIHILLTIFMLTLVWQCANISSPTGGPKDVYSPKVLESDPPNYSTHFEAKRIELKFDEFVSVSDVTTEVFISPPLQKTPEFKTRGKSVLISFDEELRDSTTYSIFFGNAIKDITEGNAIENYNYVFSTGAKIDSLSLIGEVIDAFNLQPREEVVVMLYEDKNDTIPFDSLPFLVKPSYLTRTTPQGFFVLNNLRPGDYRLFALADGNFSATYDNFEEEIAFLDSLISPEYLVQEERDSTSADSLQTHLLNVLADSLGTADSLAVADSLVPDIPVENVYRLFMFKESLDSIQALMEAVMPREKVLRFVFRYPASDVAFRPLTPVGEDWSLREWNKDFDTLRIYIADSELDTISLEVSSDTIVFDTISFSLKEKDIRLSSKEREANQILNFARRTRGQFPFFLPYSFHTAYPIDSADFSRFLLVEEEDSMPADLEITGVARREIQLKHELREGISYVIFFPDSVVYDMLGRSNDTTRIMFSTDAYEDYGRYTLHLTNVSPYPQVIVQLLDEKENLLREEVIEEADVIKWDYLKPGNYILKAIGDINANGKWDTGDYLKMRQAEPVVYQGNRLEVRESWSFELEWEISF